MTLEELLDAMLQKSTCGVTKIRDHEDVYVVCAVGMLNRPATQEEMETPEHTLLRYKEFPELDETQVHAGSRYSTDTLLRQGAVQLPRPRPGDKYVVDSEHGIWVVHADGGTELVPRCDGDMSVYSAPGVRVWALRGENEALCAADVQVSLAMMTVKPLRHCYLVENGSDQRLMVGMAPVTIPAMQFVYEGDTYMLDGLDDESKTYKKVKKVKKMAKIASPLKDKIPGTRKEPEQLELFPNENTQTSAPETAAEQESIEQVREPFEDAADAMHAAGEFSVQPDAPALEESVADIKEAKAEPRKSRQQKQTTPIGFNFQPVIDYVSNQPDIGSANSEQILAELRSLRDMIQYGIRRMYNTAEAALKCTLNRNDVSAIVDSLNKIVHK